ncbi:hypothetical protein BH10PSE10_BH10PSE10_02880 [soil metagenome]
MRISSPNSISGDVSSKGVPERFLVKDDVLIRSSPSRYRKMAMRLQNTAPCKGRVR